MTKDFKTAQTYDSDTANSGLGWMISGIALGLMVGLGMYFYNKYEVANPTNTDQQVAQGANTEVSADENSAEAAADGAEAPNVNDLGIAEPDPISVVIENSRKEQQEKKRASFSYYAVLPNLELDITVKPSKYDIPAEDAVAASDPSGANTEEPATETLQLKSGSYLLQVASFRTMGQATTAQKKLAKKGVDANIEKKRIRGKDWYRLFIGPTEAEENIASWKAAVEKNGYKPLVVKVK